MFEYEQLSDLKSGELVVPMKKVGNLVYCIKQDGTEATYSFEDFDFDKTIGEREILEEVESSEENSSDDTSSEDISIEDSSSEELDIEIEEQNFDFDINNFTFYVKNPIEEDFYWTETRKKIIFTEKINI